jgi:uncharacterized protein (TIGR02996 family)
VSEEAAFLTAIAAQPEEDTPRLAFADWLDERDRAEEAELIRVQCELEPIRHLHGEERTDELHKLADTLYWAPREAAERWFVDRVGPRGHDVGVVFRRGFAEELRLPVQWFLEHGEAIREHFPLLQRLVVFRLNGWGERLAACEHLRGLRELDLGCWYSDEDTAALAASSHLADLEELTYWCDNRWDARWPPFRILALARSRAWPKLRKMRLMLARPTHVEALNEAAGRPIAEAIDPNTWLFPFRPDFSEHFFVGKLPDGRQLIAADVYPDDDLALAVVFDVGGDVREELEIAFPPAMLMPPGAPVHEWYANRARKEEYRAKREQHLRDTLGFEPAFVRVRQFRIGDDGPSRFRDRVVNTVGAADDPAVRPEDDYDGTARGMGGLVYDWVTSGSFQFRWCDTDWWCDERGRVTST